MRLIHFAICVAHPYEPILLTLLGLNKNLSAFNLGYRYTSRLYTMCKCFLFRFYDFALKTNLFASVQHILLPEHQILPFVF